MGNPHTYFGHRTVRDGLLSFGITCHNNEVTALTYAFVTEREPLSVYGFTFEHERPKAKIDTVGTMPYAELVHPEFAYACEKMKQTVGSEALERLRADMPAKLRVSLDYCLRALAPQATKSIDEKVA